MRQVDIITKTTTTVSYKGNDVNSLLKNICDSFHFILQEISGIKHILENGEELSVDDFEEIEGICCEMLDELDD